MRAQKIKCGAAHTGYIRLVVHGDVTICRFQHVANGPVPAVPDADDLRLLRDKAVAFARRPVVPQKMLLERPFPLLRKAIVLNVVDTGIPAVHNVVYKAHVGRMLHVQRHAQNVVDGVETLVGPWDDGDRRACILALMAQYLPHHARWDAPKLALGRAALVLAKRPPFHRIEVHRVVERRHIG